MATDQSIFGEALNTIVVAAALELRDKIEVELKTVEANQKAPRDEKRHWIMLDVYKRIGITCPVDLDKLLAATKEVSYDRSFD